jgi:hypothetical protein
MVRWLVIAFAGGISIGVMAARRFTADWVGATGTWVGAIATIATIIWAVQTFQHQTRQRLEDLGRESADKLKREFDLAVNVTVRCSGGAAEGLLDQPPDPPTWSLNTIWILLVNGTREPATILNFQLPGIGLRANVMRVLPATLTAGQNFRVDINIDPFRVPVDQVSDQNPLSMATPTLRYRIAGATWERTGDDPPIRIDPTF